MIRISLPWVLDVTSTIDGLDAVTVGHQLKEDFYHLFSAKSQLEALFGQSVYGAYLRVSRQKATDLHAALTTTIGDGSWNSTRVLSDFEVWSIKYKRDQFKTVFLSELSTLPSFLVTSKESYDTIQLIENGVSLFPPSLLRKAPETQSDAMEVGKALAFELATACGFHAFRVTESVVRRYWDKVSNGKSRPALETLGNFAAEMEKQSIGEPKIVESIKQMTKLHRNPLIHPEVILSVEEAISIVGIARSVVGAILTVLPDVPPTTGLPAPIVSEESS
jgi:hypothetical protein